MKEASGEYRHAVQAELRGQATEGQIEMLEDDLERWRLELQTMKREIETDIHARRAELFGFIGKPTHLRLTHAYSEWKSLAQAEIGQIILRLGQLKLRIQEQRDAAWEQENEGPTIDDAILAELRAIRKLLEEQRGAQR